MNNPRSITLPSSKVASYPCESINKVVSEETLPSLTTAERRSAYAELLQAAFAVNTEIQVATDRAVLPPHHLNYQEMDQKWLSRAKVLRNAVGNLLWQIREYDRSLPEHPIIVEAIEIRRKADRRQRRQQCLIDTFTELVAEEIGEERLVELLRQAGVETDEWMRDQNPDLEFAIPQGGLVRQALDF
jgi:hypothetical protein